MTYYIGILDGSDETWGVRIPDCPGAYGSGATPEEAIASAVSGLAAWADAALKDGEKLPAASGLAAIKDQIEASEAFVHIPLLLDSGRTVRVNMSFDASFLDLVDAEAEKRGLTRSAFFSSAAREKIVAQR